MWLVFWIFQSYLADPLIEYSNLVVIFPIIKLEERRMALIIYNGKMLVFSLLKLFNIKIKILPLSHFRKNCEVSLKSFCKHDREQIE